MSQTLLRRLFPRDLHHVAGFHQVIAQTTPERGRLLDLGCGVNCDLATYRTADREVWGADFQRHPHLEHAGWFRQLGADGSIPFPDAHFDAVATVMVLEHVVAPEPFFREVARVLKPGGRFIGHSISGTHYVTLLRRLIGVLPHSFNQFLVKKLYHRAEVDTFPAYYRLNTPRQLRRHAAMAGLTLQALHRYADPGYFHFSAPLEALAIVTDRLLDGVMSGCGRLYFTFVAQKPER
jgi:SAM-dependent methyltransferase